MDIERYYFALTNFCNRSCELCSCHSDPTKTTNLDFERFKDNLKADYYEAQLEGGEPTIHPDFDRMVDYLIKDSRCQRIILCTNAATIPIAKRNGVVHEEESLEKIKQWFDKFNGKPFVLKPSINSHLISHSAVHWEKMALIKKAFESGLVDGQLVFNVRRIPKPMTSDGEAWIIDKLKELGLYQYCNDFEYQRYGKGKLEEDLQLPYIIPNPVKFFLIAPDGKNFGTDLVARADYMENLK